MRRVPLLRHLSHRSLSRDEAGALPVFEAIIAGMLVLTAILFLTAIGRPGPGSGQSGIDLAQNAADTLRILRDRDADNPTLYPDRLTEIVSEAMLGNTADAEAFLDEIVPLGTRYLLRLDNGVEPLVLLPHGSGPALTPRAAQAASVLVMPNWTVNGYLADVPDAAAIRPGEAIPSGHAAEAANSDFLYAPDGSLSMPDGSSWQEYWNQVGQQGSVPVDVPYGVWRACDTPCSTDTKFKVVHPSWRDFNDDADYPLYGVQLVVWLAA